MKTKVLYVLFFLYMLMVFSCRRQDADNPWQNYSWTDPFAYTRETDEDIPKPVDSSWVKDVPVYGYVIPEVKYELDTCISPALRKCITSYIDKYYEEGIDEYFCIYFFRKKGIDYFTIWKYQFSPKRFIEDWCPGISFQYYWFIMHRQEIVLIFNPDSEQVLPFSSCINQFGEGCVTSLPRPIYTMATNLFFFRTYEYIQKDNDFYIEPLKDTIYLGDVRGFAYELRYLRKENGLSED